VTRRLLGTALALLVLLAGAAVAGSTAAAGTGPAPGSVTTTLGWDTAGFPTDDATARTGRGAIAWPGVGEQPAVVPEVPAAAVRDTGGHAAPDDAVAEPPEGTSTRQERAPPAEIG
jgi:hypothetical protein